MLFWHTGQEELAADAHLGGSSTDAALRRRIAGEGTQGALAGTALALALAEADVVADPVVVRFGRRRDQ